MAGRPRKVVAISTGKISRQEKINRSLQEERIKVDRDAIEAEAPKWLSKEAAAEYTRVVSEAKKINLFDNLDMAILAIYADSYDKYIKATKKISEDGMVKVVRGEFYPSPYTTIADKMATLILKCSTKLGLAVTDRLKLIVPTKEEKSINKFLEHLK